MWINGFWQSGFWVSGFWEGDALPPEVGGDLSPLAVAVQGIGFTPVHVALQGIYAVVSGTSRLKYWDGSAWQSKVLKYFDGSLWTTKTLKAWNGSTWI